MKNKKKFFIRLLIIIAILILVFSACIISKTTLYTYNPIRAVIGYIAVKILDVDYIDVQNIGERVIYARHEWDFNKYMEDQGFVEILENQLGSVHTFTNGKTKLSIYITGTRVRVYCFDFKIKDDSGISIEERKQNYKIHKEEVERKYQSSIIEVNMINANI